MTFSPRRISMRKKVFSPFPSSELSCVALAVTDVFLSLSEKLTWFPVTGRIDILKRNSELKSVFYSYLHL